MIPVITGCLGNIMNDLPVNLKSIVNIPIAEDTMIPVISGCPGNIMNDLPVNLKPLLTFPLQRIQ